MGYVLPYEEPSLARQQKAKSFIEQQVRLLVALVEAMHGLEIKTWADVKAWRAQKILSEPLWKISEAYDKHCTRYVSVGAAEYMRAHKTWQDERPVPIQHDHIVDRAVLAEAALTERWRIESLTRLSVACLVLTGEHRLPPGSIQEPWRKYTRLQVIDCRTRELVDYGSHGNPRHWHDAP
jgi:hypothetical protein